jgi:hypothetical protein
VSEDAMFDMWKVCNEAVALNVRAYTAYLEAKLPPLPREDEEDC